MWGAKQHVTTPTLDLNAYLADMSNAEGLEVRAVADRYC